MILCVCRYISAEKAQEMSIDDFISDIQCAKCLEYYLEIKNQ